MQLVNLTSTTQNGQNLFFNCRRIKKLQVILGVSEGAAKYMTGFKTVSAMVSAMVDSLGITVPVALHLDHGSYEGAKAALEAGFSSIMFDGSHYGIEENIEKTKKSLNYVTQKVYLQKQKLDQLVEKKTVSLVKVKQLIQKNVK